MPHPNRRREDRCLIVKLWDEVAPYWHILTGSLIFLIAAVTWGNEVSGYQPQIAKNASDIAQMSVKQTDVEARVRVLEATVNDIKKDTGAIYGILTRRGDDK